MASQNVSASVKNWMKIPGLLRDSGDPDLAKYAARLFVEYPPPGLFFLLLMCFGGEVIGLIYCIIVIFFFFFFFWFCFLSILYLFFFTFFVLFDYYYSGRCGCECIHSNDEFPPTNSCI